MGTVVIVWLAAVVAFCFGMIVCGRFTSAKIDEARAETDLMREAAAAVLAEWDVLPSDRAFSLPEVSDWLVRFMAPACEKLRKNVEAKR